MLRKIQSLPQYADRSLHEMSIRHLLVEKLSDEDFKNVSDNLTTAFENLEKLEDVMNKLVFHELESQPSSETTSSSSSSFASDSVKAGFAVDTLGAGFAIKMDGLAIISENEEKYGKLGSPRPFIDTVPEVKKYLETLKNQVKMALARLSDLDTSSDTFGQWISNLSIGGAFKKFRDYVPLLQASNELALKTQTFAGGLMKGIEAIKDRYVKVLKPFLKNTKAPDMTIEQIMAATGKDPKKVRKKIESDIRKSMDAGGIKQAFSAFKSKINFLPGLRKSLVGPVEDLTNTIPKMPEEIAKSLMGIKLSNLTGNVDFKPKPIDSSDAQDALKDTEEAAQELKDEAEEETEASSEELVEPGEESAVESEVDDMARDAVSTAEDPNESEDAVEDTVLKAIENWENQLSDRQKKRLNAKGRLNKLKQAVQDVTPPEVDPPADPEEVAKAGRQWKEKYIDDPESPLSNPKNVSHVQIKRLIDLFPQIVNKIQEDETEKDQQGEEQKNEKKNESINRKKMQLISESRQLQRWQLLAGLK